MRNIILGVYSLPHALFCDSSCFGEEINITISNIQGKFCFPNIKDELLPDKQRNPILTCPIKGQTWFNVPKNGETEWGRVISFPNYSAYVSKVILKFENISQRDIKTIYYNISNWFYKFYNLKNIITCQSNYYSNFEITSSPPALDLYKFNDTLERVFVGENFVSSTIELGDNGLSFEECKQITELTNDSKPISFEYDKYQLAVQAFDKKNYSMVILNGSIAIEKALVVKIKEVCKIKKFSFIKLSEKYKMLGGIFSLAEKLKISLPTSDYRSCINRLRNKVVHDGYSPTKQEAKKFLKDTRKYLESFSNILEQ